LVFRAGLIVDDDVRARVDAQLSVRVPRWGVMSRSQLASRIDKVVARAGHTAVRRRGNLIADRQVVVGDVDCGLAEISATVLAPDAQAFADSLTALARTVCTADPRSIAERRAGAVGVLAVRGDRLGRRCGQCDCPAGGTAASPMVIRVIAERSTIDGAG
jgi:hypothetical protein